MFSPSSVPLLFLISVYLDNDWEAEQEELLLDFLTDYLLGKKELLPSSLSQFVDSVRDANLTFDAVDLPSFLLDQVPKLCENRFSLESFLKEVSELLITEEIDLDSNSSNSGRVSPHSLFGIFIKTCLVDFENLSFEEAGAFFKNVSSFCANEMASIQIDLAERFVDHQILLLENSTGIPLPQEICTALERMDEFVPSLYKRHYLGYLDGLRRGDLQASLTCLRKYFDHSIKDKAASPVQYAALNLAALYTRLGYPSKAHSAIQIGMLYARDENDQDCLSYLLCWLHQIMFNISKSNHLGFRMKECEMLESLAKRTRSQNQHHLAVLCDLRKAKFRMECGDTEASVFDCINEAIQMSVKCNLSKIKSSILLTKATAYKLFGMYLDALIVKGNPKRAILILDELIYSASEKTPALDLASALAQLAVYRLEWGNPDEAFLLLKKAKSMFPIKYCIEESREWLAALGFVIIESCLLCGDSDNCQKYLEIFLHRFAEDPLIQFQFLMKKALLFHQVGRSEDACNILNNLIDQTFDQRGPYVYAQIQAKINLVDILMQSDPQQGHITALIHLSGSISLSKTFHFDLLLKLALLRSAHQQLLMNRADKALKILNEIGPQIDRQGSLIDRGYSKPDFLNAKLYLQEAIQHYEKMSASKNLEDCWLLQAQIDIFLDNTYDRDTALEKMGQKKRKKLDMESLADLLPF